MSFSIAASSASELEYPLLLALDLGDLPRDAHATLTEHTAEVERMLFRFMPSLASDSGQLTADSPCVVLATPG